jgi:hypothetical protein
MLRRSAVLFVCAFAALALAIPMFPGEILLQLPSESTDTPQAMGGDEYTPVSKLDMNAPPKSDAATVVEISAFIEVPVAKDQPAQPAGHTYQSIVSSDTTMTASFLETDSDNDEIGSSDMMAGVAPTLTEDMDPKVDLSRMFAQAPPMPSHGQANANAMMPETVPHGADSMSMEPSSFLKAKKGVKPVSSGFDMNSHSGSGSDMMNDVTTGPRSMGKLEMSAKAAHVEEAPKPAQPDAMQLSSGASNSGPVFDLVDEQQLVEDKETAGEGHPMPEAGGVVSGSLADDMERNVKITQNPDFNF